MPGPTSDVCILTANGTSGSVDAIATPSISIHSIQVGQGVGLAFGSETMSIATTLTSQGYLTLFGTTLSATSVNMQSGTLVGGEPSRVRSRTMAVFAHFALLLVTIW